jgi:Ca-activated chloride channel family protein
MNEGISPMLASTLSGIEWTKPSGLWWSLACVIAIALLVRLWLWRRTALRKLADANLLTQLAPNVLRAKHGLRVTLLALALVSLAVALFDPRTGGRTEKVEQRGVDLMVVIDVSRSMLAEDAQPNRLARARQFAMDLVDALGSDRVGLIEFAGVPALRCPLTFNHRAFVTQLETLSPQATIRGGSLLGDAIRLAAASLTGDTATKSTGGAIVILTDGEDMQSEPIEAAAQANERGIRVVTIGIGDPREGARIPVQSGALRRYLVHEGQEVWTKMDPSLLREVADAGGGFFVEAGTTQADIAATANLLRAGLQQRTTEAKDVSTKDPLFQWLAAIALLMLAAECVVGQPTASRFRTVGGSP